MSNCDILKLERRIEILCDNIDDIKKDIIKIKNDILRLENTFTLHNETDEER